MSVSTARSTVVRLQKEIADLRVKDAQQTKKEADLNAKMVKASNDARTTRNLSTATSNANEASRAANGIASVQKKRADLAKSLASKSADLHRAQTALEKCEDTDRKKFAADQRKADDARAMQLKKLDQQLAAQRLSIIETPLAIAHAPGTTAPESCTQSTTCSSALYGSRIRSGRRRRPSAPWHALSMLCLAIYADDRTLGSRCVIGQARRRRPRRGRCRDGKCGRDFLLPAGLDRLSGDCLSCSASLALGGRPLP